MDYRDLLHLNENYNFDVLVKDGVKNFAGKLNISPEECILRVMGEREFSNDFSQSEVLVCESFRNWFLLTEIKLNTHRVTSLRQDDPENQGIFWELEFKVGFIIKSVGPLSKETLFNGFVIDSDILKKWTGITNKQVNLINQHKNSSFDMNLFSLKLENLGVLSLYYSYNSHISLTSISSGVKFTPKLTFFFEQAKSIQVIIEEIKKLYVLLTYLWGNDFLINNLTLSINNSDDRYISCFYNTKAKKDLIKYPLMPLGFDVRDEVAGYTGLPLELFSNYYILSNREVDFFTRYLRYKRLKSNEEKFLGYFRILERLVHDTGTYVDVNKLENLLEKSQEYLIKKLECRRKDIKSFAKRILNANSGKYNTATCITHFLEVLPEELKNNMQYGKPDIGKICTLRNDMTHANEYEVSEKDLYNYTNFVHQLLVYALFNKLLNLPLDILNPIRTNFRDI